MSAFIARDLAYLCRWAYTFWPWRISRKPEVMGYILRSLYWQKVVEDGWFLGIPLWLGEKRGKG